MRFLARDARYAVRLLLKRPGFALLAILTALLFQVTPTDRLTFVSIAAVLAGTALVASYVPARRAMRVDPIEALRHE